nr:MAG: Histone-like Protein p6 [Bacteriophage sp.]
MRSISKEFKKYTIHAVRIAKVDGKIVNQPLKAVETYDTVTEKNAVKIVKEKMGFDKSELIIVENIVETVEKYTMAGEKFLEHATKVTE